MRGRALRRRLVVGAFAVASVLALPGTAFADPAGLRADVRRIIAGFEVGGWFIDDDQFREVVPVVLESVCRTPRADRSAALRQLAAGRNDPRALFDAASRRLTAEVKEALTWEREYEALARAMAHAARDCPFWVDPVPGYTGRQTSYNKWVLHLESGGLAQLLRQQDELRLGGGGYGRLLVGYGFGDHLGILAGAELGGGAFLTDATESGAQDFSLGYFAAVPVVLRLRNVDWHYDIELAGLSFLAGLGEPLVFGGRVGGAVGLGVLRRQGFLPWAGIAVAYEQYFSGDPSRRMAILRGGFRLGFRWFGFE